MNRVDIIKRFAELNKDRKIIICGHERPDADSTSSQFALQFLLRKLGMSQVYCVRQTSYQKNLLPLLCDVSTIKINEIPADALLVCVDCASFKRISKDIQAMFSEVSLQIDHHASNENYGKINIVDVYASSTAQYIAELFQALNILPDLSIANLLYAGLISDSRSFSLPTTTTKTFEVAKWLIDCAVKPNEIYNVVFNCESIGKINLQKVVFNNMEFFCDGRICISYILQKDMQDASAENPDKSGLVEKLIAIDGVEIVAIINESIDKLKVNLRSLSMDIKVNEIAEFYGGGGHYEAAACDVKNKTIAELKLELVQQFKARLK